MSRSGNKDVYVGRRVIPHTFPVWVHIKAGLPDLVASELVCVDWARQKYFGVSFDCLGSFLYQKPCKSVVSWVFFSYYLLYFKVPHAPCVSCFAFQCLLLSFSCSLRSPPFLSLFSLSVHLLSSCICGVPVLRPCISPVLPVLLLFHMFCASSVCTLFKCLYSWICLFPLFAFPLSDSFLSAYFCTYFLVFLDVGT